MCTKGAIRRITQFGGRDVPYPQPLIAQHAISQFRKFINAVLAEDASFYQVVVVPKAHSAECSLLKMCNGPRSYDSDATPLKGNTWLHLTGLQSALVSQGDISAAHLGHQSLTWCTWITWITWSHLEAALCIFGWGHCMPVTGQHNPQTGNFFHPSVKKVAISFIMSDAAIHNNEWVE